MGGLGAIVEMEIYLRGKQNMMNKHSAEIAIELINRNIQALNNRDQSVLLDCFHIPHVRISESDTLIYNSREQLEDNYWKDFIARAGAEWDHTVLDWAEPMHASEQKAHIFIQWSRCRSDDTIITTQKALWIVNKRCGIWGVQARSSFAPE